MTILSFRWIAATLLLLAAGPLLALENIRIGIGAFRPKPLVQTQWAPLAAALNQAIPEYHFSIEAYYNDELGAAVAARQIDFVLANPSNYLLMNSRSGLSAPLVTLSNIEQGVPASAFGGVIFTRADRTDIQSLADLRGKSVAITTPSSFAGYQAQAYELVHAGLNITDIHLIALGQPQDQVVDAALARRADVGFIRSGVLEDMIREGKLDGTQIAVINQQKLTGFPAKISTRLYPEWPFAALPQTDPELKRKIASFLLNLHENTALARTLRINGFDVPADYSSVEALLRELHLPPFDVTPEFTLNDIWHRYQLAIIADLLLFGLFLTLSITLLLLNRRLQAEKSISQKNAARLAESEDFNRTLVEHSPIGLALTGMDGKLIEINPAFADIIGRSVEETKRLSHWDITPTSYADQEQKQLHYLRVSGRYGPYEKEYIHKNGHLVDVRLNGLIVQRQSTQYIWSSVEDISARKQAEEDIHNLAFYDPLTGLANRRLLIDHLQLALSTSARNQHYGAVLFVDMDKFKVLNDTLGHDYGDLLLVEVASRIQACLREIDTVARLGGDEFVVLLVEIDTQPDAATQKVALIAEKIRAALAAPYQLRDYLQHSTPSIGVSLYRGTEQSFDVLLKCADIAMYQAKDTGRNTVRFFDPAMQQAVETHASLEADLRHAVSERQLHLYYQVQMGSDLRPIGAEALIRWIHPTRGMVSPMQFIPIAEESGLILDIGNWVLDTACRQLKAWAKEEHTRNLLIAVNVSAQQFKQHDFVETVANILRTHTIDASRLKLELTESVVLKDVKDVIAKMRALKALGVKLSMDDFGTGYSSLSYLKQLPLDQLKIDQSFVRDMISDPSDAVMVRTIIDMANNFRLNVIAEGVETEDQMDFLRHLGCVAYQGYYFSKPVPIAQFEALLSG